MREVDLAHAPAADELDEPVLVELLAAGATRRSARTGIGACGEGAPLGRRTSPDARHGAARSGERVCLAPCTHRAAPRGVL